MFEQSLVISQQHHASSAQRWTTFASVTLQVGLAAIFMALPILHPEAMPFRSAAPKVFMPPLKRPELKPIPVQTIPETVIASGIPVPAQNSFTAPAQIPRHISSDEGPAPQLLTSINMGAGMGTGSAPTLAIGTPAPSRTVTAAPARPLPRVSDGVSAGMLLAPIQPTYPVIAKAAHVEGTVIVEAVISRSGLTESLKVVSGPEMLRVSALEAIRAARYRPYRLNGEPTEVQTTITVKFRLSI